MSRTQGMVIKKDNQRRKIFIFWAQTLALELQLQLCLTISCSLILRSQVLLERKFTKREMNVNGEQLSISYLAIQMVHTSLGPCLRGHSTWADFNKPSLDFAFSFEVPLNFDVAFLQGTLNPLAWCVNCQLAVFAQRGFRTHSSATLLADWSLLSVWGDRRELRRLGWDVLLGDCWLPLFCFFISSFGESADKW